jgi:elongation factor Tu
LRTVTDAGEPLRFVVRDAFIITGRGTVAAGYIETGRVRTGDEVEWVREDEARRVRVLAVEFIRQVPIQDPPTMGLIVSDLTPSDLQPGDIFRSPRRRD